MGRGGGGGVRVKMAVYVCSMYVDKNYQKLIKKRFRILKKGTTTEVKIYSAIFTEIRTHKFSYFQIASCSQLFKLTIPFALAFLNTTKRNSPGN